MYGTPITDRLADARQRQAGGNGLDGKKKRDAAKAERHPAYDGEAWA